MRSRCVRDVLLIGLLSAAPLAAQAPPAPTAQSPTPSATPTIPGWFRVSFFFDAAGISYADGTSSSLSEVITAVAAQSPVREQAGIDYRLDMRFAGYPSSEGRTTRWSIYDAYVGAHWADGRYAVKGGQLFLSDLGGLGALGGAAFEARFRKPGSAMQLRVGGFGGVEPEILSPGWVSGTTKLGAYAVYESTATVRRHVLGYVYLRDHGLTERSVITFTNYVPLWKKAFVYQAAEIDLTGPAGQGQGGLSYFFVNGRYRPERRFDVQGSYHRGRSLDTRGITTDVINGRPIDPKALDGFLFESAGCRVTVEVAPRVRVFGGYTRDRNNRDDAASDRVRFGVWATNLLKTGLDVNVSDARTSQAGSTTYDAWYASVGRSVTPRVYLTGDYSSSVTALRFVAGSDFTLISRPRVHRFSISSLFHLSRPVSLQVTAERVEDSALTEFRFLSGITWRF
jgi:hypothetical protein